VTEVPKGKCSKEVGHLSEGVGGVLTSTFSASTSTPTQFHGQPRTGRIMWVMAVGPPFREVGTFSASVLRCLANQMGPNAPYNTWVTA